MTVQPDAGAIRANTRANELCIERVHELRRHRRPDVPDSMQVHFAFECLVLCGIELAARHRIDIVSIDHPDLELIENTARICGLSNTDIQCITTVMDWCLYPFAPAAPPRPPDTVWLLVERFFVALSSP
jgi:hypothetical protein